jgi:hypothetical protein
MDLDISGSVDVKFGLSKDGLTGRIKNDATLDLKWE